MVRVVPGVVRLALALLGGLLAASMFVVLRSRRRLGDALQRAHSDALTGLPNRAALDEALVRMVGQAARRAARLAIVMMDIDHFKAINDRYGHPKGDEVLAAVGAMARSEVRTGDFVGRYGGEEFMLMLPDTDEEGALKVAEKLRRACGRLDVPDLEGPIAASFGVAAGNGSRDELLLLVGAADAALYSAKDHGRNRVEHAAPASELYAIA